MNVERRRLARKNKILGQAERRIKILRDGLDSVQDKRSNLEENSIGKTYTSVSTVPAKDLDKDKDAKATSLGCKEVEATTSEFAAPVNVVEGGLRNRAKRVSFAENVTEPLLSQSTDETDTTGMNEGRSFKNSSFLHGSYIKRVVLLITPFCIHYLGDLLPGYLQFSYVWIFILVELPLLALFSGDFQTKGNNLTLSLLSLAIKLCGVSTGAVDSLISCLKLASVVFQDLCIFLYSAIILTLL